GDCPLAQERRFRPVPQLHGLLVLYAGFVVLAFERQRECIVLLGAGQLAAERPLERIGLDRFLEILLGFLVILGVHAQFAQRRHRFGVVGKTLEQLLAELLRLGDLVVRAIQLEQSAVGFEVIGGKLYGIFVALFGIGLERCRLGGEDIEEPI